MIEPLNYEELRARLLSAARTTFLEVRREHADEKFYAFGLLHEPLWGFIDFACNTEEGLIRVAEEYKLDKHGLGYARQSVGELARKLRWNPGDWAYLRHGRAQFDPVNDWLRENDVYKRIADVDDDDWKQMDDGMINICRNILLALDREGVFGSGPERDQVVVNIMMGDQDRSWIEHARILNPQHVFERWLAEIGEGWSE